MPKQLHHDPEPSPFHAVAKPAHTTDSTATTQHPAAQPQIESGKPHSMWDAVAPIAAQGVASYLSAHPGAVKALQGWGAKIDGWLHKAGDFLSHLGGTSDAGHHGSEATPHPAPALAAAKAAGAKAEPPKAQEPEPAPPVKTDGVAAHAEVTPGHESASSPKAPSSEAQADKAGSDKNADPWRSVLKGQTRLKAGDSGAAVAKMQSELSQAGFAVPASGVFDEATKKALLKFQNTYHIQATGELGPQTSNGLEEVVGWKGVASGKDILEPGEQGPSVTMLQRQLVAAGYKVDLSGVYDPKTSAVVKELQRSKGWGPDGKVGPLTVGAIKELQHEDSASTGPDNANHVPSDKEGRAVYDDNKARLRDLKLQLSQGQKGDMDLFLRNFDKNEARYDSVAQKANMPPELIAALHWRESSGDFGTYLHQGDPLGRPPRHWPTNIPTFYKWEDAASDALHRQKDAQQMFHIGRDTTDMAALASYSEYYNGLGYHYKDKPSPYAFSGTNQYQRGKYVADGHYDPSAKDSQLGTVAMIEALREHEHKTQAPKPAPEAGDPRSNISLTMAAHPWLEDKTQAPKPDGAKPATEAPAQAPSKVPVPAHAPVPTPTEKPQAHAQPGPVAEPQTEAAKYEYYRHAVEGMGGQFDARPEQRNIVGVRGWMNGHPVPNVKDQYNDTLAVLWNDKLGKHHVEKYNATVDPGAFPKYYNPAGDANLMEGQYDYVLGDHKGHTALNQGEAVNVWRDANKDGIRQKNEKSESGWFGINVHAGGVEPQVSNWSAGCQVIRGGWGGDPWQNFIHQMKADPDHRYKYTVIDSQHMPHQQPEDPTKQQGHG
ncbi:MAG TPA: peptidoglycan-binding protein [Pseudomonadota bacterium]|nr:peptidoglycan-binding protein [Pseudomonadota bacterium]